MFRLIALRIAICCFILLVGLANVAFAQVQASRIVGTVLDPNQAGVPNSAVTVTDEATNIAQKVLTNESGAYVVTPLNPGIYRVSVSAAGFQTMVRNQVELLVDQAVRLDFDLKLGETSTSIEVTTAAPLLNSESGTPGQVITNTQIVNLP